MVGKDARYDFDLKFIGTSFVASLHLQILISSKKIKVDLAFYLLNSKAM